MYARKKGGKNTKQGEIMYLQQVPVLTNAKLKTLKFSHLLLRSHFQNAAGTDHNKINTFMGKV